MWTRKDTQPHQYVSIFMCNERIWGGLRGHNIDTWFNGWHFVQGHIENRRCGTKVRLVLQIKEIFLSNTVHKTFLTLFPGQILVLATGIFRQKPVSESFLQYDDNGMLDENKTNMYPPLDTAHIQSRPNC